MENQIEFSTTWESLGIWRHEYMTLLMRDQENIEKGIEKGILGMVSTLKDLEVPEATIIQKIQEKFKFSQEEAERYVR